MKSGRGFLYLFCAIIIAGCTRYPTQPGPDEPSHRPTSLHQIYGTWIQEERVGSETVMLKSAGLDSDNYGFVIDSIGSFVERKNAGWCGTPPISYANFSGEWNAETDSLLHIDVAYWGGRTSYNIHIVTLTDSVMRFRYEEYRPDQADEYAGSI
ncbi:MAG: hypothetical protein HY961_06490 [Ignavibacteriae bacterium]|nr:hypothetical protein [Ignavibacteriota bacterium]